jgi:LPXTG-site transpeptidase (sortase) family protein
MFREAYLRRLLASLAIITLFSLTAGQALAVGFADTQGTDYGPAFAYLKSKNIVQGYADGFARPGYPLNRVEGLKVILMAQGSNQQRLTHFTKNTPPIPLFSDVDQTQWYTPYLETAFEKRVITGYPDGTFRPAKLLSVEEAVTLLVRTFNEQSVETDALASLYIENQPNQWFTTSINAAVDKNLIMHKGTLRLGSAITRGQFFDMVYRLHSSRVNNQAAYAGIEPDTQLRSVVPVQRTVVGEDFGPTGVISYDSDADVPVAVLPQVQQGPTQPANVTIAPKIDHPYASEKYFSISMPSIGVIDLTITHPQDAVSKDGVLSVLKHGVGHLFSYPGAGGKMMVYGHSSGYPWDVSEYSKIFRRINELSPGDKVYVTYAGTLYVYQVSYEETIIAKNANKAFQDEGVGEELILFTCWPPDSIAQRYLVHAVPVETIAQK